MDPATAVFFMVLSSMAVATIDAIYEKYRQRPIARIKRRGKKAKKEIDQASRIYKREAKRVLRSKKRR